MSDCDLDLNQLLADPIVRLLMSSDGVQERDIRDLAERIGPRHAVRPAPVRRRAGDTDVVLRHLPSCRGRPAPSAQPSA